MKKFVVTLLLTGFISAGAINTAAACEGGKCKMEHKDGKDKKGKKSAENCHMTAKAETSDKSKTATASCCMKKDAKAEAKTTKETKAQK